MRVAQPQVLRAGIADAGTTVGAAKQRTERAGTLAAHIAETVGGEHLILIAEAMIEPHIETVLIVHVILVGKIVVGQPGQVGLRIKIGHLLSDGVDRTRRNHVQLSAA